MKTTAPLICVAHLILGTYFTAHAATAVTYEFRNGVNGYNGQSSSYISSYSPDNNSGGLAYVQALNWTVRNGHSVIAFMRWDLSDVDGSAGIAQASLQLTIDGREQRSATGYSATYNLYPVLRAGLDYGNGNGAVPVEGAISYSSALYSSDPEKRIGWGTSGTITKGPVAGEDYSDVLLGSFTLTADNTTRTTMTIALDPEVIASWVNNPSTNYGFIIIGEPQSPYDVDSVLIRTEGQTTVEWRPYLQVETIPEPGAVALLLGGSVLFFGYRLAK